MVQNGPYLNPQLNSNTMKQIWQEIKDRWPLAVLGALAGLLTAILW